MEKVSLSMPAFYSFLFSYTNPWTPKLLPFFSCKPEYFSANPKCFDLEVLLIHYVGALDELPHACFYFCIGRTWEGKFLVPRDTLNQDVAMGCTTGAI